MYVSSKFEVLFCAAYSFYVFLQTHDHPGPGQGRRLIVIYGLLVYEMQALAGGFGWVLENTGGRIEALYGWVPCLILDKPSLWTG